MFIVVGLIIAIVVLVVAIVVVVVAKIDSFYDADAVESVSSGAFVGFRRRFPALSLRSAEKKVPENLRESEGDEERDGRKPRRRRGENELKKKLEMEID